MCDVILIERPGWLAVDKPAGVVVIPGRYESPAGCLWRRLERERGERLWVVHRLDRGTSGVLLFARHAQAHRILSEGFEKGWIRKTYLAFTRGVPHPAKGRVDLALHTARKGKMRPAKPGEKGAQAAVTEYRTIARWTLPDHTEIGWLELKPCSGRLHQVRVHLRALGAPLLVDSLYGRSESASASALGLSASELCIERLTLHAARLEFPDPETGEPVCLDSPLSPDLQILKEALDRRSGAPGTSESAHGWR